MTRLAGAAIHQIARHTGSRMVHVRFCSVGLWLWHQGLSAKDNSRRTADPDQGPRNAPAANTR